MYNTCILCIINICYHIKDVVLNCIGWPHIILNNLNTLFQQTTKKMPHKWNNNNKLKVFLYRKINAKMQKNSTKKAPDLFKFVNLLNNKKNDHPCPCPPFMLLLLLLMFIKSLFFHHLSCNWFCCYWSEKCSKENPLPK